MDCVEICKGWKQMVKFPLSSELRGTERSDGKAMSLFISRESMRDTKLSYTVPSPLASDKRD